MKTWPADVRQLLDRELEVDIETTRGDGRRHRTTIWVVVDGEDAFVRSYRGDAGAWYRDVIRHPEAVLHAGGRQLAVRAQRADDAQSIERCSRALERKYAGDPSMPPMLRDEVLPTTLRLGPV